MINQVNGKVNGHANGHARGIGAEGRAVGANEFLPFAIRPGSNVLDQSEYEKQDFREEGFEKGVLASSRTNKVWRQAAFVSAGTAQMIATIIGEDVLDNGRLDIFVQQLIEAISAIGGPIVIGATPPVGAKPGTLWWDPDSAQLYVFFDDGDSQQWVIANHVGAGAGSGGTSPYVPTTGGTMTGPLILSRNPVETMEAASKQYVDAHTSVSVLTSVLVSSMAALRMDGGTY
jgi:hypothetical protein